MDGGITGVTEFVFLQRGLRDMTSALEGGVDKADSLLSNDTSDAEKTYRARQKAGLRLREC